MGQIDKLGSVRICGVSYSCALETLLMLVLVYSNLYLDRRGLLHVMCADRFPSTHNSFEASELLLVCFLPCPELGR